MEKEVSKENVEEFYEEYKKGNLERYVKSEPEPETQGAVYTLVGKTFKDIINDPSKDVLVKFYAPWCGHCKKVKTLLTLKSNKSISKLAPIYEKLAEELQENSHLILADIDATQNDVEGIQIKGYPTLKLFPGGPKRKVIDYEGNREPEDIKRFLRENAYHPVHIPFQTEDL
jgi:protein disulfide isomerase